MLNSIKRKTINSSYNVDTSKWKIFVDITEDEIWRLNMTGCGDYVMSRGNLSINVDKDTIIKLFGPEVINDIK